MVIKQTQQKLTSAARPVRPLQLITKLHKSKTTPIILVLGRSLHKLMQFTYFVVDEFSNNKSKTWVFVKLNAVNFSQHPLHLDRKLLVTQCFMI